MSLIKEELHSEFKRYLKYLLLIDIVEILENNRGMITYVFPEVKLQKLISWFSPLKDSETYSDKDIKNKISSIGSRLYGDEKLKVLYKSLKTLINTGFS